MTDLVQEIAEEVAKTYVFDFMPKMLHKPEIVRAWAEWSKIVLKDPVAAKLAERDAEVRENIENIYLIVQKESCGHYPLSCGRQFVDDIEREVRKALALFGVRSGVC